MKKAEPSSSGQLNNNAQPNNNVQPKENSGHSFAAAATEHLALDAAGAFIGSTIGGPTGAVVGAFIGSLLHTGTLEGSGSNSNAAPEKKNQPSSK